MARGNMSVKEHPLFEKARWILEVVKVLIDKKFSGTLLIDFHEGNPSRKYKTQIINYAEGGE